MDDSESEVGRLTFCGRPIGGGLIVLLRPSPRGLHTESDFVTEHFCVSLLSSRFHEAPVAAADRASRT